MARFIASPRKRRRVARLAMVAGGVAVIGLVVALIPHQSGRPGPPGGFGGAPVQLEPDARTDPATERARLAAEVTTRPYAVQFVKDIVGRTSLARAYDQLAPNLQERFSREAWEDGRGLPFDRQVGGYQSGSTVAYSGPTRVGWVVSYQPENDNERSRLYAVRYIKKNNEWSVDYAKEGHSSTYVSDREYAPVGFLPGSATTTIWWWLTIPLALVVIIGGIAIIDNRLGRGAV